MQKILVTIACVFVLVFQGGFNDSIWSLMGILFAVYLVFFGKKKPLAPVVLLFLSVIAVYTVAMFYHGLTFEALASVNRVMVVFLAVMVFSNIEADIDSTMFITGLVAAGIGIAAFTGILPWEGAVTARRLQSTFQYANAAGLFFVVSAFIVHRHDKRRPYAFVLETAMLLTQSVGAIIVYIVGSAVYAIIKKAGAGYLICSLMLAGASAAVIFGFVYIIQMPPVGALALLIILALWKWQQPRLNNFAKKKLVLWVGVGSLPIIGVGLVFMRGLRPLATYLERVIHSYDGIRVMLSYPFGLGPGGWQFQVEQYQSALYAISKIHNEYVSMGVDAGILVLVPVLAVIAYWFKKKKWDYVSIGAAMILVHGVADIPFSFLLIVMVLAMLVASGLETKPMHVCMRFALVVPIVLGVIVFSTMVVKNRAAWLASGGETRAAIHMLDNRPVRSDTDAILIQMQLFYDLNERDNIERVFQYLPRPVAGAYFIRASSALNNYAPEEAIGLAMRGIALAPYRARGFSLARQIIVHLDYDMQLVYQQKMELYMAGVRVNPLSIYITRILEGGR